MSLIQIIAAMFLLILFVLIIFLLKTGRLKEKYSVLWLIGIIIMLILTVSRRPLEQISLFFGVYYAPSFLFVFAFLVILALLLHFSVAISGFEKKQKTLAQRLVVMEQKLKDMGGNGPLEEQTDDNKEKEGQET